MLKYLPEKFSGWPCVRWPPCARFMPRIVSPGFSTRHVHGHVRLRARVRLHVDVLGAEQLLRAGDRQRFGDVHELAAAVVALARVAFGVLVRHHRAGRFHHGQADEVLGGDQLQPFFLPLNFVAEWRRRSRGRRQRGGAWEQYRRSGLGAWLGNARSLKPRASGLEPIERGDLVEAALMPAAGKRRGRETPRRWRRASSGDVSRSPSARTLASLCSRLSRGRSRVGDRRGADAGDLVGRDGHADAGAAHEDAALEVARRDRACDGDGEVGVVHRVGRMRAEVRAVRCRARRASVECRLSGRRRHDRRRGPCACAKYSVRLRAERYGETSPGGEAPGLGR